jgi:predicted amidohydrolase
LAFSRRRYRVDEAHALGKGGLIFLHHSPLTCTTHWELFGTNARACRVRHGRSAVSNNGCVALGLRRSAHSGAFYLAHAFFVRRTQREQCAMESFALSKDDDTKVRIACIQMQPVIGRVEDNVMHSVSLIERAVERGAELIVLPELSNSGYMFNSREEAFALSEPIPDGPTVKAWSEIASRHKLHLVAGICERDGAKLFNSAVLIGPNGYIGTFRKVHLWNEENLYFEPGDLGFPVYHTAIGRIGMAICYDGWFPETYRLAALQGADIVCVPTNWVPIPGQAPGREAMANILAMAAAHSNSIYIACADRVGTERGQPFEGQSLIVGHTGWPVAGPASRDKEEIVIADVALGEARRARNWNAFNQVLRDRRSDLYDEMLGSDVKRGWY